MSVFWNALVSAITGVISGFGVGGGTLLILYLTFCTGMPQTSAQGINLLYFVPTAAASLIGHIKNRLIDLRAFLYAAGAGGLATIGSSYLVGILPEEWVRRIFGVFLLVIGVRELLRK